MPSAPPSCCIVVKAPPAPPATSRGTAARTTLASGMICSDRPIPEITSPGTTGQKSVAPSTCGAPILTARVPSAIRTQPEKHQNPAVAAGGGDRERGGDEDADGGSEGGQPRGERGGTHAPPEADGEDQEKPCRPAANAAITASPAANAGMRNRVGRRSGATRAWLRRCSSRPSATSPVKPAASTSQPQPGQPWLRPSTSG